MPTGVVSCLLKMASKSVSVIALGVGGDDLTQIKGIGPAIARRLYAAGILTYVRLSKLSPFDLASRISGVSAKRIEREGWILQAGRLSAKSRIRAQRGDRGRSQRFSQHYATFVVEFLLNKDVSIRRTKIVYVQNAVEKSWTGWKESWLIKFIIQNSGLRISPSKSSSRPCREHLGRGDEHAQTSSRSAQDAPDPRSKDIGDTQRDLVPVPELAAPFESRSQLAFDIFSEPIGSPKPKSSTAVGPLSVDLACSMQEISPAGLSGTIQIPEIMVTSLTSDLPRITVRTSEAFRTCLTIDLTDVTRSPETLLYYNVVVWAKKLGEKSTQIAGETQGSATPINKIPCAVETTILAQGTYRLEVVVGVAQSMDELLLGNNLKTMRKSGYIQVF